MVIVTGCARSGTMRIAKALQSARVNCAFEPEVNGETDYSCKVSWLSAPSLKSSDTIWHITRSPVLVAASLRRAGVFARDVQNEYTDIVYQAIGDGMLGSSIPELDYWIDWNKLIERHPVVRRIDTSIFGLIDTIRVAESVGVEPNIDNIVIGILADKKLNSCGDDPVFFDLAEYERLDELAYYCGRYGYYGLLEGVI